MFSSEPASHPGDHRGSALPRPGRRAPSAGVEDTSRMPPPAPRLGEENPPDGGPPLRKPAPANVSSLPQPSRVSGTWFAPTPRNRPNTATSVLDTSIEPQPHAVPPTPAVMDVSLPDPLSETQPMGTTPDAYRGPTTTTNTQSLFTVPPPMPPHVHSDATQTSDPYVTRMPHPQHHHTSVPAYRIGSHRTTSPGRIVPPITSTPTHPPVSHHHVATRRQPPPPTAAATRSGNGVYDATPSSPRSVIGGGDGTAVGQIRRSRSPHINVVPTGAAPPSRDNRRQNTPPTSSSSGRPPFPGWDAPADPTIHHVVHQPQPTNVALVQETYDADNDAPAYEDNAHADHNNNGDNYNSNQPSQNINNNQEYGYRSTNNQAHHTEPIFVNPIDERFSAHSSPNNNHNIMGRGARTTNNEPFGGGDDAKSPSVSAIKYQPHPQHTLAGGGRGPGGPGGSSATPVSPSATRQLHFNSQSPSSALGNNNNTRGGSNDSSSRYPYGGGGSSSSTAAQPTPTSYQQQTTTEHHQNRQPQRGGDTSNNIPATTPNSIRPGDGLKRVPSGGVRTYKIPSRRPSNPNNNSATSSTNPRQLNGFTLHTSTANEDSANNKVGTRHVDNSAVRPSVVATAPETPVTNNNNSMGASVASRRSHSSIASARSKSFSPTHRSASQASLHRSSPKIGADDINVDDIDESSASSSLSDMDRPHVHTRWAPPAEEIMLSVCESASEDDDVPTLTVLGREASPQYKASPQVLGMNVSRSQSVRSVRSMSPVQHQQRQRSRAGSVSSQVGSPHHHHIGYYMPKEEPPAMRHRVVPAYVDPALRETFMKAIGGGSTSTSAPGIGARSMGQGRGPGGAAAPRDDAYKWKDGINTRRLSPQRSSASPPPPPPQPPTPQVRATSEPTPETTISEPASPPHIKPIEPIIPDTTEEPIMDEIVAPEPDVIVGNDNDAAAVTAPPSPAKPTDPLPYYGRTDSPTDPTDVPQTVKFGKVQVREVYPYLINGMTEKQYKQLMLTNMNAINESKAPKVKQGCCS